MVHLCFGAQPARGGGMSTGMSTPLRRRLLGGPDLQGRWAHRRAVGRWSCLGVLAVVPGVDRSSTDPIRPIEPRPSRSVSSAADRGRRLSLAVPSFFDCGDTPRGRDRRRG